MRIEDVSILVCDDSILARKQLKDVISTLGTPTFYEAADGVDAVQMTSGNNAVASDFFTGFDCIFFCVDVNA